MNENNETNKRLRLVFTKLKVEAVKTGIKPTVSKVAQAAGVSHSLIYNKHPTLALEIRENNGKTPANILAISRETVEKTKMRLRELRRELADQNLVNKGLSSQNGTLVLLVKQLTLRVTALEGGAIPLRPRPKK